MKTISYDLDESQASGKHKFMSQIRKYLSKHFTEVPKDSKSDIHLFVDKPNKKSRCNIYRIDGVWINTKQDYISLNARIKKHIEISKGVIYQNIFCQECVHRILNISHKNENVILNGSSVDDIKIDHFINENPFFIAVCKWRPHKRLKAIVNGFLESDIKGVDLVVFGDPDYKINHPNIKYLGWKETGIVNSALVQSVASVHLAWLDWCPNSVVEAIAAKKQVIYTTSGGTKHIVKQRGYAIEDFEWNFKPHKLYNPPEIDVKKVADAYIQSYYHPVDIKDNYDINIQNISNEYINFINYTLGNS